MVSRSYHRFESGSNHNFLCHKSRKVKFCKMSVWRNEEDFMRNLNTLSEFYIKDKKLTTPKKLNVQTKKQDKSWYDSDSDDEINEKGQIADGSSKCPSMEPMDTLQMMESIRMQVRNVVGDRYSNEVLETYYKMDQEPDSKPSTSSIISGSTVPFFQPQVNESSSNSNTKIKKNIPLSVNGHKTDVNEPVASSSKSNYSHNVKNKFQTRGKKYSNRGGGRGPSRYNNVAFASLQSKESYNYQSKSEFPPL